MKIIRELWVFFLLSSSLAVSQKTYGAEPITQAVHYDDEEESPSIGSNSPYPQIEEPKSSLYENTYQSPKSHQYNIEPTSPHYRKSQPNEPSKLYGYYTSPKKYISARPSKDSYENDSTYSSKHHKSPKEEDGDREYKKLISGSKEITYDEPEELQYSHDHEEKPSSYKAPPTTHGSYPAAHLSSYPAPAEHSSSYQEPAAHLSSYPAPAAHSASYPASVRDSLSYPAPAAHSSSYHAPAAHSSSYPAPAIHSSSYPASAEDSASYPAPEAHSTSYPTPGKPSPLKRDPKLPLYFTMYEKRIVQDPLDKYGKGPWRYLTYGHGITYGSKEPGKVFEKGYGYIRALGRDHCELPKHLCPPTDEKPFEYDGRKEPYFGYRPH